MLRLVLFLCLTCCASFACAAEEMTLRLLVWGRYAPPEDVAQFRAYIQDKYGVSLTFRIREVADEDEFFKAARSSQESEQADLISPSKSVLKHFKWNMIKQGLVLPLRLDNIPNFTALHPYFQNLPDIRQDGELFGVPYAWGPYGILYNTQVFKQPPRSWSIFWDPQYAGRYGINGTSPGGENVVVAALMEGVARDQVFDIEKFNTPGVVRRLQALADNSKVQWAGESHGGHLKGLAFGAGWGGGLAEVKTMGETWKLTVPDEGASGWIDVWAITQHLRDKPLLRQIAEEYINFFISAEKQAEVVVRKTTTFPVNFDSRRYLTAEEIEASRIDDPQMLERLVFLRALSKRDYNGLKLLWYQANLKNRHKVMK